MEPQARARGLLLSNEKIFVLAGGHCGDGPLADVWLGSRGPAGTRWTEVKQQSLPLDTPFWPLKNRMDYAGCLLGDFLFVFGGISLDGEAIAVLNDLWCLDLRSSIWRCITEEAPCSERSSHVAVGVPPLLDRDGATVSSGDKGCIVIHGGECLNRQMGDVWLFEVAGEQWHLLSDASSVVGQQGPCARFNHVACYCKAIDRIAFFGGITLTASEQDDQQPEPQYLNDLWLLDLNSWRNSGRENGHNTGQIRWVPAPCEGRAPSPRDQPGFCSSGHGLLILGGYGLKDAAPSDTTMVEEEDIKPNPNPNPNPESASASASSGEQIASESQEGGEERRDSREKTIFRNASRGEDTSKTRERMEYLRGLGVEVDLVLDKTKKEQNPPPTPVCSTMESQMDSLSVSATNSVSTLERAEDVGVGPGTGAGTSGINEREVSEEKERQGESEGEGCAEEKEEMSTDEDEDGEEEIADEESIDEFEDCDDIQVGYLSDLWHVDMRTLEVRELTPLGRGLYGRGVGMATGAKNSLLTFGGFSGEEFHGSSEEISKMLAI